MPKAKRDQLFRIIAALDRHFSAEDVSPADAVKWRELKRHIARMKNALELAAVALQEPLTEDTASLIQGYVRLGLSGGEKP
jgi:hypothetical protein